MGMKRDLIVSAEFSQIDFPVKISGAGARLADYFAVLAREHGR